MGDRSRRIGDAFPRRAPARALQRLRQAAGQAARVSAAEVLRGPTATPRGGEILSPFRDFSRPCSQEKFPSGRAANSLCPLPTTGTFRAPAIRAADCSAIGWSKFRRADPPPRSAASDADTTAGACAL